ncbi:Uridine 5'-monophosphate synthase-like 1 [Homarus americanus]|uniref:Uridine 5'-monophosphate synthase-like 1 n=1 Tax=Homarus americanus TaxID=6706 RepID=A0A8J5T1T1_HOMAM|nr:Uridine 5'-monophosphate synthase-like 1 [Homarus americanus]
MGINVVSVVTMTEMMAILLKHGLVDHTTHESVLEFISSHQDTSIVTKEKSSSKEGIQVMDRKKRSFKSRIATTNQPLARKLFEIMSIKKTNLCVAADVTTSKELLSLTEKVGPHICVLKTHIDILADFSQDTVAALKDLAVKHNFLIFEDRLHVWIIYVAAVITSKGVSTDIAAEIDCVTRVCNPILGCGKMAENHTSFVVGFVSQSSISGDPRFIVFTPGVQLNKTTDGLGQQYVTPRAAVFERGADVIIVGRGITQASDPVAAAKKYREEAFLAYEERVSIQ